ncbi:MAG: DNA primase, partial [Sphingomonas sp.]|nr:DNA primase [Sphingomonas sp.]
FTPRAQWKKGKDGRFSPPETPPGSNMRAIGTSGIDRATARALVLGHALFPDAIADHVETLAALPIADAAAARLRDRMVDLTMSGQTLDRQAIATILAAGDTGAAWRDVTKGGDMRFTFTRPESDDGLARRDLSLAIEALVATAEIEQALAAATERFKADMDDETAFAEQQRLHAAREAMKERLASLASNE